MGDGGGVLGINLISLMSRQVSSGTYKASTAVRKIKGCYWREVLFNLGVENCYNVHLCDKDFFTLF